MYLRSGKLFLQNKVGRTSLGLKLILDSLFSKFIESDSSPESLPSAHCDRKDTNREDFLSTGAGSDTDTLFANDFDEMRHSFLISKSEILIFVI